MTREIGSPHCYLVDHTGTHRLPPHHAELILTTEPGIDIYPTDRTLAYRPGGD